MRSALLFSLVLASIAILVFSTGFTGGEGWYWALGNGLGFIALAGLLYLSMDARNGAKLKRHAHFGYVVFLLLVVHALWFPIGDPIALEYIKPGAPAYMWAGVVAILLTGFLLYCSTTSNRRKEFASADSFRRFHKYLALGIVVSSTYHIIGSGFYLHRYWQWALLSALVLAVFLLSRRRWFRDSHAGVLTSLGLFALLAFVVIREFIP